MVEVAVIVCGALMGGGVVEMARRALLGARMERAMVLSEGAGPVARPR